VLAGLPDASAQCVVTSPPYFGLRDYGTASWEGGEAACDHLHKVGGTASSTLGEASGGHAISDEARVRSTTRSFVPYANQCGKCGATRIDAQIGLESTVEAYVAELVAVFREVRRVLRDDGVLFLNLGDSYATSPTGSYGTKSGLNGAQTSEKYKQTIRDVYTKKADTVRSSGLKPKDLIGVPWRVAFALQADGWYLRSDIIWSKPNPMPESVRDRPTKSHEYIFLLSKSPRYFWDAEAVKEQGVEPERGRNDRIGGANGYTVRHSEGGMVGASATRNIRSVWNISTQPFALAHFATFPAALAERCIKAGSAVGDVVLDPFGGAGTVSLVAERLGRNSIYIDLSPEYAAMAEKRIRGECPMFTTITTEKVTRP
jgi:DNA modification methylase